MPNNEEEAQTLEALLQDLLVSGLEAGKTLSEIEEDVNQILAEQETDEEDN